MTDTQASKPMVDGSLMSMNRPVWRDRVWKDGKNMPSDQVSLPHQDLMAIVKFKGLREA